MKKPNDIVRVIAIVVFTTCLLSACIPRRGNGIMKTAETPVSSFEGIEINGYAVVYFHESPEYRAVVTADSNLFGYTNVYTEDNVLKIGLKRGWHYLLTKYQVDVYCPVISSLSISGAARFESSDTIITPVFKAAISGAGKIKGAIECDTFTAAVSGSAQIILTGSSNDFGISISGAGDFSGNDFKTNNASVKINGAGTINIWVVEYLKAQISGTGRIRYRGNPKIDSGGSGLQRLERNS